MRGSRPRCTRPSWRCRSSSCLIWRSETHGGAIHAAGSNGSRNGSGSIRRCEIAGRCSTSASLAFAVLVFLFAVFNRKLTLSRNLAFRAIVLAVSFVMLPRIVFGSAYADMRLVPYLFAVALLAIRFRGATDRAHGSCPGGDRRAAVLRGPARQPIRRVSQSRRETRRLSSRRSVICRPGARVASFVAMPCREWWPLPRNSHLGGLVIDRRDGFLERPMADRGRQPARAKVHCAPGSFA